MAGMTDEEMWMRRVAEWKASGQPATTFCAGRGFSASALRYWGKRLEKKLTEPAPAPAVRIARLVRDDAGGPAAEGLISIEVGATRLTVGRGFDRAALRSVLEVLAELGTAR